MPAPVSPPPAAPEALARLVALGADVDQLYKGLEEFDNALYPQATVLRAALVGAKGAWALLVRQVAGTTVP